MNRTLGEIMKLRNCVMLVLAMAALGAGPPPVVQPAQQPSPQASSAQSPSAWSKLKSGARRLLPGSAEQTAPADVRYDAQVRPATAVAPQPQRRSFFKSAQRPKRTLSEYMAWEKP